ncbi:VirK/YbjX family protein [Chitinimonas sp.]|uniref:VirK/YbjX family protein n=1 Tax=Chitinimonas sp. TaxID=1934313 RepID=UPI0035AF18C7
MLSRPARLFGGLGRWKYFLRGLFIYPWAQRWAEYLLTDEQGRQLLSLKPRLLLKLQRPYLRGTACVRQRLRWLMQHFGWMRQHWPWHFTQALYRNGQHRLATFSGANEHYTLVLQPTDKCDREGELILSLECQGESLALLSFSILRHRLDWVASVGCLQGPRADAGRERVKAATHDLHGLRPKQAVLLALYALVQHYRIAGIHAVANDSHIHKARLRSRNRVRACYDSFWEEMGGCRQGDSFVLPPQLARKELSAIASRKRAQYRRRHELEDIVLQQICAALPPCLNQDTLAPALPAGIVAAYPGRETPALPVAA